MACEVADGLRRLRKTIQARQRRAFQWPVKWPMVCAGRRVVASAFAGVVSMACEVADGLRPFF